MGAYTVLLNGSCMLRRAVAFVALPTVTAVAARKLNHDAVAGDLGDDGGRRHRQRQAIATDHGAGFGGEAPWNDIAVDQCRAHRHAERAISESHAPQARLQDVDLVDAPPVSYTHLRAHETKANLVCRL